MSGGDYNTTGVTGMGGSMVTLYGAPPIDDWTRPIVAPSIPFVPPLTPAEQTAAERVLGNLQADAELAALAQVIGAMSGLDADAKARIADYVAAKWGTKR